MQYAAKKDKVKAGRAIKNKNMSLLLYLFTENAVLAQHTRYLDIRVD